MLGALALVVVGLVMTALMQSSTAAIAVTLSAYYAGAVGLDQGCALIIGQNIGTAQFRTGGHRRKHHRQAVGHRVCAVQNGRCGHCTGAFSHCHSFARPCFQDD
jgi:hypothetical protein